MKRTAGVAAAWAAAVALVQSLAVQGATAIAGADQVVMSVASVSLNGGASKDGKPGYSWSQVSGPAVKLDDAGTATPRFTAPPVTPGENVELVFELSVSEPGQPVAKDRVSVWVMSWKAVDNGYRHTVALRSDGSLWAWGENCQGRLGPGDTSTSRVAAPRRVMDGVTQVSTGGTHTLVLRSDGSISGFGSNAQLQLTKAALRQVTTPTPVAGPAGWSFVSAGDGVSLAIKGDELFGFGRGRGGALGLGDCPGEGTECAVGTPTSLGAGWRSALLGM